MPDFIAGKGTGWFGPYLNLLPIFTITLFIIQQKVLMPKATDEQQQMTQTMMMYMTVFMGVLFFKVPAGLCIYFITSSTWSLVERQLVKRMLPKTTPNLAMAGAAPARGPWSTFPHPNPRPLTSLSKAPKVRFRRLDRNVPRSSRTSFHGSVGSKVKPRRTKGDPSLRPVLPIARSGRTNSAHPHWAGRFFSMNSDYLQVGSAACYDWLPLLHCAISAA